ncbi:MAG: FMN-binding protein [Chitinispirillaceae bacterium]|nr:FMN-binding protein [Chitinispirillaceae bacterium]
MKDSARTVFYQNTQASGNSGFILRTGDAHRSEHLLFQYNAKDQESVVTVKNQQIRHIEITKRYRRKWFKMSEGVVSRVIEAQNTTVDAVSGATTSSKALLMAIHNALVSKEKRILK